MADERTVESDAWAVISNLRDQHPRVPNDCPTDYIVESLAAAGLLAAPAARLPAGAASQIATTVHNALCDCMGSNTGITLRSSDWDLVRAAVAALLESWQGASLVAPADDEAAIERMTAAIWNGFFSNPLWYGDVDHSVRALWRGMATAALAALREGQ